MVNRRNLLKSLFLWTAAFKTSSALAAPPPFKITRFVIVNGWVLTEADLARLEDHAF